MTNRMSDLSSAKSITAEEMIVRELRSIGEMLPTLYCQLNPDGCKTLSRITDRVTRIADAVAALPAIPAQEPVAAQRWKHIWCSHPQAVVDALNSGYEPMSHFAEWGGTPCMVLRRPVPATDGAREGGSTVKPLTETQMALVKKQADKGADTGAMVYINGEWLQSMEQELRLARRRLAAVAHLGKRWAGVTEAGGYDPTYALAMGACGKHIIHALALTAEEPSDA